MLRACLALGGFCLAVLCAKGLLADNLPRSVAAEGAQVYFIAPQDGAVVTSPLRVVFGLKGMGVAPAGVSMEHTGHHHLLIDVATLPAMDAPLPKNEHYQHFGLGQTEASIELAPGVHTLQLLLADHNHIPHDPPILSEKITITVK